MFFCNVVCEQMIILQCGMQTNDYFVMWYANNDYFAMWFVNNDYFANNITIDFLGCGM